MVHSRSELVIANTLYHLGIPYQYEQRLELPLTGQPVLPDFLFADPAGDPIIWEHPGMLFKDDYRLSWERKRQWYLEHGFVEGKNLFTASDDERGRLDSILVR